MHDPKTQDASTNIRRKPVIVNVNTRSVPGAYPQAVADTVNYSNPPPNYGTPPPNYSNQAPYTSVIRASISDLERRILSNASVLVPDHRLTVVTAKQDLWSGSKMKWFYTAAVVSPKNPRCRTEGWLVEFKAMVRLKGLTPGDMEEARGQAMEHLLEELEMKIAGQLFSRFMGAHGGVHREGMAASWWMHSGLATL